MLRHSGRHLIVDGFGDPTRLRSRNFVEGFLRAVVDRAGMKLIDLRVYEVPEVPDLGTGEFVDTGGVTGFAILTTSHATIHTWPTRGEFRFDVYSCREFDGEDLGEYVLRELRGRAEQTINWVR